MGRELTLVDVVEDVRGCTFVGLDLETVPDMYVKNNPFHGRIVKRQTMRVEINSDYEKKALAVDPDYQRGTSWHEAIVRKDGTVCPLSFHKKTYGLYLRCIIQHVKNVRYFDSETGEEVSVDALKPFLKVKEHRDVPFITLNLASVKTIRISNDEFDF